MATPVVKEKSRSEQEREKEALSEELQQVVNAVTASRRNSRLPVSPELVQNLCNILEAIFIHGLKDPFFLRGSRYAKYPEPNFWPFLSKYSHRSVTSQINSFNQIKTEIGKSRAWVRLVMNESTLEHYFGLLCKEKTAINQFYKEEAFILDDPRMEKAKEATKELGKLNISAPTNSSLLNTWTPTPLILSGLAEGRTVKLGSLSTLRRKSSLDEPPVETGFSALDLLPCSADRVSQLRPSGSSFSRLQGRRRSSARLEESEDDASSVYSHPSMLGDQTPPVWSIESEEKKETDSLVTRRISRKRNESSASSGSRKTTSEGVRSVERREKIEQNTERIVTRIDEKVVEESRVRSETIADSGVESLSAGATISASLDEKVQPLELSAAEEIGEITEGASNIQEIPQESTHSTEQTPTLSQSKEGEVSKYIKEPQSKNAACRELLLEAPETNGEIAGTSKTAEELVAISEKEEELAVTLKTEKELAMTLKTEKELAVTLKTEKELAVTLKTEKELAVTLKTEKELAVTLKTEKELAVTLKTEKELAVTSKMEKELAVIFKVEEIVGFSKEEELAGTLKTENELAETSMDEEELPKLPKAVDLPSKTLNLRQELSIAEKLEEKGEKENKRPIQADERLLSHLSHFTLQRQSAAIPVPNQGLSYDHSVFSPGNSLLGRSWASPVGLQYNRPAPNNTYVDDSGEDTALDGEAEHGEGGEEEETDAASEKDEMELLSCMTKISAEKGLDSQEFRCAMCKATISPPTYRKYNVCPFDAKYYCSECWAQGGDCIVPGRLLLNWETKPRKVSSRARAFLSSIGDRPLIDVKNVSPSLYEHAPALKEVKELREQLKLACKYLFQCRISVAEDIRKRLFPKEYFVKNIHLYSYNDLTCVVAGTLARTLKVLIKFAIGHVQQCLLCTGKGFYCETCGDGRPIYPFQTDIAQRCSECYSVFHTTCKERENWECPRCKRRALFATRRHSFNPALKIDL